MVQFVRTRSLQPLPPGVKDRKRPRLDQTTSDIQSLQHHNSLLARLRSAPRLTFVSVGKVGSKNSSCDRVKEISTRETIVPHLRCKAKIYDHCGCWLRRIGALQKGFI